jgi:hypothetical protein
VKVTKYSGYYLLFTGLIHNILGLTFGWPVLLEMHNEGWLATTIVNGQMQFDREAIVWFLNAGCFWMMFGWLLQKALEQGFTPPKSLGWGFVIIGIVYVVIMPISGAYLFVVQGGILIYGSNTNLSPN